MELTRTAGLAMLLLSQNGVPPAQTQTELTPLQRRALLEALQYQHEQQERADREAMRRHR